MMSHRIVLRLETGKMMVRPEKKLSIELSVPFFLGTLKREFESDFINDNRVENSDEIYFIFIIDNGMKLGIYGDQDVKYTDFVSGGEPIIRMVRITGGQFSLVQPPMLILKRWDTILSCQGCYR